MYTYAKHAGYSILGFFLFGFGIALQIKAGIGQSMLNAFALTISEVLDTEIGNILNLINLVFFVCYILVRKTRMDYKDIVQIVATIACGFVINFYVYFLLAGVQVTAYYLQVSIFLVGLTLSSASLGAILAIGVIKFPLESLCIVLGEKYSKKITSIRIRFDVFFLLSTLILFITTDVSLNIREGTVISFLILARLMGVSYYFFKKRIYILEAKCVK